jgi:hypothetical protein
MKRDVKKIFKTILVIAGIFTVIAGITKLFVSMFASRALRIRYVLDMYKKYVESYRNGCICGTVTFEKDDFGLWTRTIRIKNLASGELIEMEEKDLTAEEENLLAIALEQTFDEDSFEEEQTPQEERNTDSVVITTSDDGYVRLHPGFSRVYVNLIDKKVNDYAKNNQYVTLS